MLGRGVIDNQHIYTMSDLDRDIDQHTAQSTAIKYGREQK